MRVSQATAMVIPVCAMHRTKALGVCDGKRFKKVNVEDVAF